MHGCCVAGAAPDGAVQPGNFAIRAYLVSQRSFLSTGVPCSQHITAALAVPNLQENKKRTQNKSIGKTQTLISAHTHVQVIQCTPDTSYNKETSAHRCFIPCAHSSAACMLGQAVNAAAN
jgi:hypothetical protein